jgi:hypothetical protein
MPMTEEERQAIDARFDGFKAMAPTMREGGR